MNNIPNMGEMFGEIEAEFEKLLKKDMYIEPLILMGMENGIWSCAVTYTRRCEGAGTMTRYLGSSRDKCLLVALYLTLKELKVKAARL